MNIKNNTQYILKTSIKNLLCINPTIFYDERGFFREFGKIKDIDMYIKPLSFHPVQFNHSLSKPGVIRGLHAENWNKLIYPITGKAFLAFVDVRPRSKTFGKVVIEIVDDKSRRAFFVPKGIANSICAMSNKKKESVNYVYIVDSYYDGSDTTAICYDDPDLAIKWPVKKPIVSERDKRNRTIRQLFPQKFS